MSDTIPPLYSSSPPPLTKSNFTDDADSEEDEDDDDDGYGKFEEYSTVYDHTVEEILNNSPRKPIKTECRTSLNSSDLIGKNIPDLPNNLNSTSDLNLSSGHLPSDILHSSSPDKSINCKILENHSINVETTFSDSAINFTGADDIFSVNSDNSVCNLTTSKTSEPVNFFVNDATVSTENGLNHSGSVAIKSQATGGSSYDSASEEVLNAISKLDTNKDTIGSISSNLNIDGISCVPLSNCSNSTSMVDGTAADDDFEFDDFQSFSGPMPSFTSHEASAWTSEKLQALAESDTYNAAESFFNENKVSSIDVASAQIKTNPLNKTSETVSSDFNNFVSSNDAFKVLETSSSSKVNDSHPISNCTKNSVQTNSNDLSNGFNVFENVTEQYRNVTKIESNFEPFHSLNALAASQSNLITEAIMKAGKKSAESIESCFKRSCGTSADKFSLNLPDKVSLNLRDKVSLNLPTNEDNEDDGFGDFECVSALQNSQNSKTDSSSPQPVAPNQADFLSDDDFCDFESVSTLTVKPPEKTESSAFDQSVTRTKDSPAFKTELAAFAGQSTDDFSDFKSTNLDQKNSSDSLDLKPAKNDEKVEDDLGNFEASFSEVPGDVTAPSASKCDDGAEEDFDDFSDFSNYEQSSDLKTGDLGCAALGNKFWVDLFPPSEEGLREIDVVSISDLVVASRIWTKLRDLETSQALAFDWSKSVSYNKYLASLNIDVRNVFGVQWRSNVPRFAANLGCAPLEPSKAAKDSYSSKPVPDEAKEVLHPNHPDLVPAAHFDWISSGLVNPLDGSYSTLLDINLLDTFVNTESTKKKGPPTAEVPKQKAKDEAIDAEVQEFLKSLPDLSFMLVSHIQFPMNPTNSDKSS